MTIVLQSVLYDVIAWICELRRPIGRHRLARGERSTMDLCAEGWGHTLALQQKVMARPEATVLRPAVTIGGRRDAFLRGDTDAFVLAEFDRILAATGIACTPIGVRMVTEVFDVR